MPENFNRRNFLKTGILSVAGAVCAKTSFPAHFGGYEKIKNIGLQLYTVRKELERDFSGTLAKIAAIGYREVEFAGYFNNSPEAVKNALEINNLTAPSAHISLGAIRENLSETIKTAQVIGHKYLICGNLPSAERISLDNYKKIAALFNSAGEICRKNGIQFGYHNHDFEFQAIDGKIPYDVLLAETDSNLVKMELDLYWIAKAGRNPLKYFRDFPNRFMLLHAKDMDNSPKKNFTEVGRGVINFREIFAEAKKAGVKHYFVEQDQTAASPFESIGISYDYLRKLNF